VAHAFQSCCPIQPLRLLLETTGMLFLPSWSPYSREARELWFDLYEAVQRMVNRATAYKVAEGA
jgi:hypothetical protein